MKKRNDKQAKLPFQLWTRNSLRGFVRPSIGRSVGWSVRLELKMQETRIYDAAVVIECVWVYVSVWEGGWNEAGGWLPLPTHPQQYSDPASLVIFISFSFCLFFSSFLSFFLSYFLQFFLLSSVLSSSLRLFLFICVHATLHPALSVRRSVRPSVRWSVHHTLLFYDITSTLKSF